MAEIKPTVISTFAGCGGSSLGYHLAGFEELLAVEWDDNAAATFKLNFPDVPLFHGDIGNLSVEECLKRSGLQARQLDIFDGSPPCQGFSTAGNRKFNDPRNSLFKEFARLLEGLQPKVFVMENVTGMIKGCMKQAYLAIVSDLKDCGYQVKGQVLNAMYYNVPQSRERVIIIGVRNDLGIQSSHPRPQTKPISIRQFIKFDGKPVPKSQEARMRKSVFWQGYERILSLDEPCKTIPKRYLNNGNQCFYLQKDDRLFNLSVREGQAVASFPHSFKWVGKDKDAFDRIGNSVPPNLMKAIALHVKDNILAKIKS